MEELLLGLEKFWKVIYGRLGALWIHDGNPKRPHALLTSGLHSNGFFNSKLVIADDFFMKLAAGDLLSVFFDDMFGGNPDEIEGFVGPQTGATKLANFLSEKMLLGETRFSISPAKGEEAGKKCMILTEEEKSLVMGKQLLLCEDVITTGGSIDLTVDSVKNAGGTVAPYVLALVNRSGLREVSGRRIVALINHEMQTWSAEECPLCKQGSEAIRPKENDGENWARLTAAY